MNWSPGWWVFGIAIVTLAVVLAIRSAKASARKRRAARIGALAEALTASGFSVEEDAEIPAEVPDWEIARTKNRTKLAIRVQRGDTTIHLFDHVQDNEGYTGWNMESVSSGESSTTRTYRHTLACLQAPPLTLPTFQVIPSLRDKMSDIVDASARDLEAEGHTKSAGALDMLMGVVGGLVAMQERPGALALTDQPELTADFYIYGEDEPAVRALLAGPLRDLLLSQPGAILEGQGPWLVASLNVGLAFGTSPDKKSRLESGLLSPEQTVRLVEFAFELSDALE